MMYLLLDISLLIQNNQLNPSIVFDWASGISTGIYPQLSRVAHAGDIPHEIQEQHVQSLSVQIWIQAKYPPGNKKLNQKMSKGVYPRRFMGCITLRRVYNRVVVAIPSFSVLF